MPLACDTEALLVSDPASVLADRYRLADAIGRGGMADVYSAEDTSSGHMVAVKIMRMGEHADPVRFASEMEILERLSHPAIVRLFDSGTTDDASPYFVMQLIDGQSLSALLRGEGPLDSEDAADIGSRVASALAHAHAQGVIHRDIKPANILIDADGGAYLTDFGVARLADATLVTRAGTTIGTAAYLAPEQLQDSSVGPEADVYSLGLVLLESLTGRRAFRGTGVEAAMSRLSHDPPVPRDLPEPWVRLLVAMTRRAADRRPSATEVEGALRGTAEPPVCTDDEIAARSYDPAGSDDDPTAISLPTDTNSNPSSGSGQWDPPSTGSNPSLSTAGAASPATTQTPPPPAPSAPVDTPPSPPADLAPAGSERASYGETPSDIGPPPDARGRTPEPASPGDTPPDGDAGAVLPPPTPADGLPAASATVESLTDDEEDVSPVRRGMDAIRSRALFVGLVLGAIGAVLMFALIALLLTGDDAGVVVGDEPVDDATREVLEILHASSTLDAADPALQRDLLSLSEGVVESVNQDRWDTALLGVLDIAQTAQDAIEDLDIQPSALQELLRALRDLANAIQTAAEAGAGGQQDGS